MAQSRSTDTDRLNPKLSAIKYYFFSVKIECEKKLSMVDQFFDDVQNYVPIHIKKNIADFGIPTDRNMWYLLFKKLQIIHKP